jgi:hypothetical protein
MAEMNKKGRCWKGYKPKPNSKAYSKGSCVKEQNSVEKAESDDFGSKPLVKNPIRPKGDHLTRIKKKKVTEGPDPRSKLGKLQHDQGIAWIKKKEKKNAEHAGGHDNLRKVRSAGQKIRRKTGEEAYNAWEKDGKPRDGNAKKFKVTEASDEDRMKAALEDEERVRKLKGKKPTPKALRRIPGTDEYVK